jgi:hypothetical protein
MSQVLYESWKNELDTKYKRHKKLLGYNTIAGIGVSGNIAIEIEELETQIKKLEIQIEDFEKQKQSPLILQSNTGFSPIPPLISSPSISPSNTGSSPIPSPIETQKGVMKLTHYIGIALLLLVVIGLGIIYFKDGILNIGGKDGATFSRENPQQAIKSDNNTIQRATMSGTIIYDGIYLTKNKVSRIYFEHDSHNETSDIDGGKFLLNAVIVPEDPKIIKLIVDFKDGKQGESKIIDLNTCSKTGASSYELGRQSISKIKSGGVEQSSSSTHNNKQPSSSKSPVIQNTNVTVNVNPHMEQKVNQSKIDTSGK